LLVGLFDLSGGLDLRLRLRLRLDLAFALLLCKHWRRTLNNVVASHLLFDGRGSVLQLRRPNEMEIQTRSGKDTGQTGSQKISRAIHDRPLA
jgi:hypothetical protein